MALINISGKASGHIVGGARERQEVHRFTMGSIVSVVHTPINNPTASTDHEAMTCSGVALKSGAQQSMKATFTSPETSAIIPLKLLSEASSVTA